MSDEPILAYASAATRPTIWQRLDPYRGLLALFVVFIAGIIFSPTNEKTGENVFLRPDVQMALLRRIAEFGILAAGMTFVILTAGIDLSVGSVLAFSAMTFTFFLLKQDWPAWASVVMGVGVGAVCGLINGAIISRLKLQPFVVTLAMMVFARGAARWISDSEKIQTELTVRNDGVIIREKVPIFDSWGGRLWADAPVPYLNEVFVVTLVFLATILLGWLVLSKTAYGRHVYALGGNELAAKYSGLRVDLGKTMAYVICGGLAGVAGVFNACQVGMGDPASGLYRELDAIAAVVIGGTSLMGGIGGMLLTLLGVLIIGEIETILAINNVPDPWRLMSKGMIIVGAVLIQQRRRG